MIWPKFYPADFIMTETEKEYWRNRTITNHRIVREAYPEIKRTVRYCVDHIDWMFNLGNGRREQIENMEPTQFVNATVRYGNDDDSFRRAFRKLVSWIIGDIPCWNIDQHSSIVYRCIYNEMDKIVSEHYPSTDGGDQQQSPTTFQRQCFGHFAAAKEGQAQPYDIWRRINLCAASPFWEAITVQAMLKSPEAITEALAKDLGVAYNMRIIDDEVRFLTPQELKQLREGE